ncbi:MAG: glycosyltransferase family 39 protein [Chloroflexales bacterium]
MTSKTTASGTTGQSPGAWGRLLVGLAGRMIGPWVILGVFLILVPISVPRVALSDEVQYYVYLRSVYFDHDLDFRNEYVHFAEEGRRFGDEAVANALLRPDAANPNPVTGLLRNVAPVGSAILWAPGFALADLGVIIANTRGAAIPRDGYSRPYTLAVCAMSALYCLIGLQLTYRLARRYTGDFAATLATLTVFLASPLVFYTYIAMPWSHANGFFLFALFLTVWMRGRDRERGMGTWVLLGLISGLMFMTREQLGLLLVMPALEATGQYVRKLRGRDWLGAWWLLLRHQAFLGSLLLTIIPQLLTYQILNGRPSPSSTVAGKLNWASPHFFDTLIDPVHGAFLWSPVLAIGLVGLIWLGRRDLALAGMCIIAFIAQTYINGAFGTTWHLSGSFGFRRLIECTPIIVLGLAVLVEHLRPRVGTWPLVIVALLLVYWNVGLIAQWTIIRRAEGFRLGLIWDRMLYYQFVEVPGQVLAKIHDLIFNRCKLMTNQSC